MKALFTSTVLGIAVVSTSALALVVATGNERPTLSMQLGCAVPAPTFRIAPIFGSVVRGRISHNGEPLPGVVVAVCPGQGGASRRAVTDIKGTFALPLLAPGQYAGVICLGGFNTAEFELLAPEAAIESTLALELPLTPIRME
jgi:hypothetical protein